MDRTAEIKKTLLCDTFSDESRNLYESFKNAGIDIVKACIEEDGFLPDDMISAYGFFLGDFSTNDKLPGKALYFNQVKIPKFWRIEGNNSSARIKNRGREVGRIFYAKPAHKRLVKIVDWLDDTCSVRLSEHYNKYGAIFCRTIFNKKGQKVARKFYSAYGKEVILENFVTSDILLHWQGQDRIFKNKTEFVAFFIKTAGLEDGALYYNSLSYPFFTSQLLPANGYKDALFWHEPVHDEIPGNMQIILNNQAGRTRTIYVQREEAYRRLIELGADPNIVKKMGYLYSFIRENKHRPGILICTNSDNVSHLAELVQLVPDMHFHVAALTEMSSKLLVMGRFENVSLYPNVKMAVLDNLFDICDIYLDINHGSQIVDAVCRAFLNNMLIVGFEETMHNPYYTADTNTFAEADYKDMAEALCIAGRYPQIIDEALVLQRKAALAADVEEYKKLI